MSWKNTPLTYSLVYGEAEAGVAQPGVQISGRPVAHGNQNVTWVTWKCRKIAQLAIKNSSSPVSLNYRLSVCIVIVLLLSVQLKCF